MSTAAPDRARGRLLRLRDADVHVREEGPADGPPLVLLHGFLTSAHTWRNVSPALARDHRVILVDLPGSGESPAPRGRAWSADRSADLLADLLDALDLPEAVLVGSQMGGSLAAWFAARRPERVSRLVVMAAGVLGETAANLTLYRLLATPVAGRLLARVFPRGPFEERWRAAHGPGHQHDPEALAYYHAHLRRRGHSMAVFGLGMRMSYGPGFDALAEPLRGLPVPTLLVFGEADPLVPVTTGRRFATLLPHSRLLVLPGCGDFPQEERPAEVTDAVLRFLAEDTGTRPDDGT
ncbi:pimeloyl-ACP methyl ester carboxylesterase [Actinocorallia herbida]|uniref:Pimeloyl-ACP methyl ester carboxylesterase n=1 Tax=Actinocorallia herbida TaxID=58109 RepID=A0A3N1CYR1_9ACTN|nr:alpha/beta hydrolase [Actinocorallia herbida]ROO86423.1 pimeloyl-ACP methyl ester carboxylesterase [Actinocorallia herbida]